MGWIWWLLGLEGYVFVCLGLAYAFVHKDGSFRESPRRKRQKPRRGDDALIGAVYDELNPIAESLDTMQQKMVRIKIGPLPDDAPKGMPYSIYVQKTFGECDQICRNALKRLSQMHSPVREYVTPGCSEYLREQMEEAESMRSDLYNLVYELMGMLARQNPDVLRSGLV